VAEQNSYDISKTIGYQFTKLAQLYTSRVEEELAQYDLTYSGWSVLIAVAEMKIHRPSDIVHYLHILPASLSRTLRELERHGFVERLPDPRDKRARQILATQKGQETFRQLLPNITKVGNHFPAKLTTAQFHDLRDTMADLLEGEYHIKR